MSYLRYTIASLLMGILVFYYAFMRTPDYATISGIIENAPQKSLQIVKYNFNNPLKEPTFYPIDLQHQNHYYQKIPIDSATVLFVKYKHFSYPIYIEPGQHLTISINSTTYPKNVSIKADNSKINARYNQYFQYYCYQNSKMQNAIAKAMQHLRKGDSSEMLKVDNLRIVIAMEDFSGTPFNLFVYRAMSKYFYHELQQLNNEPYINSKEFSLQRQAILKKAEEMGYFSDRSLASQPTQVIHFINQLFKSYLMQSYNNKPIKNAMYQIDDSQLQVCINAIQDLSRYVKTPRSKAFMTVQLLAQHYNSYQNRLNRKSYSQFAYHYLKNPVDDQLFQYLIKPNTYLGH
ncbi:MAG TPA: hypothetical protein VKA34_02915 [Balneolales bacterium]|nr:hypothetical protein [Balneolales bacterium]